MYCSSIKTYKQHKYFLRIKYIVLQTIINVMQIISIYYKCTKDKCIVENHRIYNYERYCNVLQNCKNANCKNSKWHVSTAEIFIIIILMALFIILALFPLFTVSFMLIRHGISDSYIVFIQLDTLFT